MPDNLIRNDTISHKRQLNDRISQMKEEVQIYVMWKTEAKDFTPWLAGQGLNLLGKTIGLDLELISEEENVGPFKADILCRDISEISATDKWVRRAVWVTIRTLPSASQH